MHLHMCVHIFLDLLPFFPATSSLSLVIPSMQDLFCPSVLQFFRRKKKKSDIFCLFEIKVPTQGVSL
jgi:hypothetical protein